MEHLKHACFSTFHALKLLSCMYHAWNATAMHEPWLFHAWRYETCMNHACFKKLASPMHKTCVWQVYHAWNMHEIFNHIWTMHVTCMKFHITSYWLEAAALQIWKLWDRKLQCLKVRVLAWLRDSHILFISLNVPHIHINKGNNYIVIASLV